VNGDDSARMRDFLASNRSLLAWIRTAASFAGLGFLVAEFGRTPDVISVSGYLRIFMVLVGLLLTSMGYAQHRATQSKETPARRTRAITMARCHGGRLLCWLVRSSPPA
jgi:uncharacterized membrane protein YidH (DUF202 family)